MRRILLTLFLYCNALFITFSSYAASPNNYQLWIEPEAGRKPIIDAIQQAHQEIDVVMYLFTDREIAQALKAAAMRGVEVKILIEKTPYEAVSANHWLNKFFSNTPHINLVWLPSNNTFHLLHQKTLIIDHQRAFIMTMNFTHSSFYPRYVERNFALADQNPQDVNTIQDIFNADYSHQKVSSLPHPTAIVLSPVNSRKQLSHLINQAQFNLKLYAIGLTDYQLIGALAHAAQHGVKVQILWDGKLTGKAARYLKRHGVILKKVDTEANHAKIIMADNHLLYLGSANFTKNSLNNNRELGVIIDNNEITGQLENTFEQDWRSQ